jgi:chromosome partitioning protein
VYLDGVIAKSHATKVLAILSQKGGSGKTTLALHLAVIAQQAGMRVLLVDCDPQRSAEGWWRARAAETPEMVATEPSSLPSVISAARDEQVALVVVDTRPSVEQDTVAVARLADFCLIPARPSILDLRAIGATVDVVKATQRRAGVVINAAPPGRGFGAGGIVTEARKGLEGYGLPVAPAAVTQRAALAYALIDGRAVTEFEPDGKAARELRQLWRWVEKELWPSAPA